MAACALQSIIAKSVFRQRLVLQHYSFSNVSINAKKLAMAMDPATGKRFWDNMATKSGDMVTANAQV